MNSKDTIKKIRKDLGDKEYKKAKDGCKRVLLFDGNNHQVWIYLGLSQFNLDEYEDSEKSYLKALEYKPDFPLIYQGLINLYEKQQNGDKLIPCYYKARECFFKNELYNKYFECTQNLIKFYENLDGEEDKVLELIQDLLPGSLHYREEYYKEGESTILEQYMRMESIIYKQKEELVTKLIDSKRRSLSSDSMIVIKYKVRTQVYEDNKYLSMILEIIKILNENGANNENEIFKKYSEKYLEHLYYLVSLTYVQNKNQLIMDMKSYAQHLINIGYHSELTYLALLNFEDVIHPELYGTKLLTNYLNSLNEEENEAIKNIGEKVLKNHMNFHTFRSELVNEEDKKLVDFYEEGCHFFLLNSLSWYYFNQKWYDLALKTSKALSHALESLLNKDLSLMKNVYDSAQLCISYCYLNTDNLSFHNQAFNILQSVLKGNSNNRYALEILLEYGLIKKNYELILRWIEDYKISEDNTNILSIKGWCLIQMDEKEAGKALLLRVIEKDDKDYKTHYRLAVLYYLEKRYELSYKHLIESLKNYPEHGEAFQYLGYYYQEVKNDFDKALRCFTQAIKFHPKLIECYKRIYDIKAQQKDWSFIQQLLDVMLIHLPNFHWGWSKKAYLEMDNKDYSSAITSFQKALKLNNEELTYWKGLGIAYLKEGRYKASLKSFLRGDINDSINQYYLAKVYTKLNQYEDAINILKLNNLELPHLILLSQAYIFYSKECFEKGDFGFSYQLLNESLKHLVQALKLSEDKAVIWELIGEALFKLRLMSDQINKIDVTNIEEIHVHLKNIFENHQQNRCIDSLKNITVKDVDLYNILTLSSLCFKSMLVSSKINSPIIYYKLALIYYTQYKMKEIETDFKSGCKILVHCIQSDPSYSKAWDLLGLFTMIKYPKLCQHALIQSSILDNHKNPSSLTHYGYLCLLQNDYELANQLFLKCIDINPEFIGTLIGKCILAKLIGDQNFNDMIQHCYELNEYQSYTIYYQYSILMYQKKQYDQGFLAIKKYIELIQNNYLAFNLLGLYYERLGLLEDSMDSFKTAKKLINEKEGENKDRVMILLNYARVLCSHRQYKESIVEYDIILKDHVNDLDENETIKLNIGLGLSHFFNQELELSFEYFEQSINMRSNQFKILGLITLAKILFHLGSEQHREMAQQLLLGSVEENEHNIEVLQVLYCLGVFSNDLELQNAALEELKGAPINLKALQDKYHYLEKIFDLEDIIHSNPRTHLNKSLFQYPNDLGMRIYFVLLSVMNLDKVNLNSLKSFIINTMLYTPISAIHLATLWKCLALIEKDLDKKKALENKAWFAAPWLKQ